MKTVDLLQRTATSGAESMAPDETDYALHLAGVYQDSVTRDWALQNFRQATQLAGEARIQNMWYDVDSLSDHEMFLNAVHAALVADVIVVSVYAAEELPLYLYVWFEAWLPRRKSRAGALTALIGITEPPDSQFVRTFEYLQAVARKAQLQFIAQERKRPAAQFPLRP
jgi:hypothetical protein